MQQFIQRLQCMPERIRNITIVAHIDHGKTTLADTLLSTNEIINQKQQGKQRFLDYLPIEQERLITVKSSSVSLVHMTENSFACSQIKKNGEIPKKGFFLAQLYDSPGHVDFTHEVLTSLSMSDGAIFVVDIVEGIRMQSQNLLKSLMRMNIQLVLVINKVDRLFTELKMTPFEAFIKIQQIIADTNNCIETMNLDMSEYFSLTKNVMIASAYSGWGVSLLQFVFNLPNIDIKFKQYSTDELLEFLGSSDAYLNQNGEIKQGKPQNCLYVKYILEPLKLIYTLTEEGQFSNNIKKLFKIHKTFTGREFTAPQQSAECFRTEMLFDIFPLGKQLLDLVVCNIPSPIYTQNTFIVQINKQINALQPFQFIGVIGKNLTDIHIDEPQQMNKGLSGRHFSLMRIVWMGQQGDYSKQELLYGCNITYQNNYNQQFSIVNIYQPLGRLFKHIDYRLISQGNIIGIETNISVRNNSLVVGQFIVNDEHSKSDSENDFGSLQVRASSTSQKQVVQTQLIGKDVINSVNQLYLKFQEQYLGYEKPLVKVCLIPDKIQNYNALCEAVKEFCETQMSVGWELSRNGDVTLFVCGDVHLDLCLEAIKETIDFDIMTSMENIFIYETYSVPELAQFQLLPSENSQEVLSEYNKTVLQHLDTSTDAKKLTTIPTLSGQQREVFLPYYYEFIGQSAPQKPAYGMEIAILTDNVVERLKLYIALTEDTSEDMKEKSASDKQSDLFQTYQDDFDNVLFIHQSVPTKIRAVLRLAFNFNMSQGILSLEPVRSCKLVVYCQNDGQKQLEMDALTSEYPHFFVKPGVGVLWMLNDIAYFIRAFLSRLRPRIIEECYDVVITIPEIAQQGVQRLLKKCRASKIQYFGIGNDGDIMFEIHAVVPQEYCLSLGAQLRSETAGAGTIQFPARRLVINDEDPRGLIEPDDEDEEQTSAQNTATKLLKKILTQKGLYVGEVVEAAEKQRTRRK